MSACRECNGARRVGSNYANCSRCIGTGVEPYGVSAAPVTDRPHELTYEQFCAAWARFIHSKRSLWARIRRHFAKPRSL